MYDVFCMAVDVVANDGCVPEDSVTPRANEKGESELVPWRFNGTRET